MHHHFRSHCGTLYHPGIRSQISLQHCNASNRHKGLINRTNNLLILISGMGNIFLHSLSGNSNAGKIQKILLRQLLHHRIHTTGFVQVLHIGIACRSQMTKVRSLCGNFVGIFHLQLNAALVSNGRKMKHGVGGASQSHIYRKRISECGFCHNASGANIFLNHIHDSIARHLCQTNTSRINRRNGSISGKSHTDNLC